METSNIRKGMPVSALFDPKIVVPAIGSAFVKLDPRTLMKNPVMFVLEIVTALTTIILAFGEWLNFPHHAASLSKRVWREGSAAIHSVQPLLPSRIGS